MYRKLEKILPDYEIREWNDNDLNNCSVRYVQEAINEKKWAFVSDYFRLYALYKEGGIYFDEFLNLDFFTGYEKYNDDIHPFTAVVGAQKGNHIIKTLLDEYNDISFYNEYGDCNLLTNTQRVENYFRDHYHLNPPFNPNRKYILEDNCIIFPANYFCEFEADVSYAVHYFNGSWVPNLSLKKRVALFNKFELKIYTIKQGHFIESLNKIVGIPIIAYPRHKKRTVIISIGVLNNDID